MKFSENDCHVHLIDLCALQPTSSLAFPENFRFLSLTVQNLQPFEIWGKSFAHRKLNKIAPR